MEYRIIAKNAFGSEEIKEDQNDGEKCLFLDLNVECFSLTVEYMNLFDISNLCLVCRTFFYEFLPLSIKRIEIFYEDSFRIKHKQFEKQFEEQFEKQFEICFRKGIERLFVFPPDSVLHTGLSARCLRGWDECQSLPRKLQRRSRA